jgi:hypothetical protein
VDLLGVEFNHDVAMQRSSGRSRALIMRNLGDRGHLSNRQGAEFVQAVLARSRRGALRHLVLLHLSQQCNLPDLAIETARSALGPPGRRIAVHAAQQSLSHPNLWIVPGRRPAGLGKLETLPDVRGRRRRAGPLRPASIDGAPILAGLLDCEPGRDEEIEIVGIP